jgi:hypothetical protein
VQHLLGASSTRTGKHKPKLRASMMITSASHVTYLPVELDEQPFPQLRKLFLRNFECNPKT